MVRAGPPHGGNMSLSSGGFGAFSQAGVEPQQPAVGQMQAAQQQQQQQQQQALEQLRPVDPVVLERGLQQQQYARQQQQYAQQQQQYAQVNFGTLFVKMV